MPDDERRLPLFPLNTVLFPGMLLPLHIFEERYRAMMGACLSSDRTFGVALIREGLEVGGPADPFEIGTFAQIVSVDRMPDGRMNLVALGVRRFRLLEVVEQRPFMVGRVVGIHPSDEQVAPALAGRVADRFQSFVRDLRGEQAPDEPPQLSDDPETLSFQISATLGLAARERQALLEAESTAERLRDLDRLIRRERAALRLLGRNLPSEHAAPFSRN